MDNEKQLARFDSSHVLGILERSNLPEEDKRALTLKMASDDIEVRRKALEMMTQSSLAQSDLAVVQQELAAIPKKGLVIRSKQTIKTGSGTVEVQVSGGDTKLIIPVLVIVGIVVIAALVIVFWK